MLKQTHGIVLKNAVFGEADLIVTYLTSHYGLLSVFAKSPRKVKSRFGSSLEPLTYARIGFFGKEEANLPRLTQSDIIKPFHALRGDFKRLLNVSEILELCLNFLPKREPAPDIFKLLLHMMTMLESNADNKLFYLFYKMRFLQTAGYLPALSACGKCGRGAPKSSEALGGGVGGDGRGADSAVQTQYHHFFIAQGTVICSRCLIGEGASIPISHGAARFHESLLRWNPSAIYRVNAPGPLVEELTAVIDAHIGYVLGPSRFANKKDFTCSF